MSSIRNSVSIEVKTITARVICASGMDVLIFICRYARNRVAYLHLARFQPCGVFLFSKLSLGINNLSKVTSKPSISGKGDVMKFADAVAAFLSSMRDRAISQEDYVHVVGRLLEEAMVIAYETRAPPSNHLSEVAIIPREHHRFSVVPCSTSVSMMGPRKWGRCVSSSIVSRQIYWRKSL